MTQGFSLFDFFGSCKGRTRLCDSWECWSRLSRSTWWRWWDEGLDDGRRNHLHREVCDLEERKPTLSCIASENLSELGRIGLNSIRCDDLFQIRERWTQRSTAIELGDDVVVTVIEFLISRYGGSWPIGFIVRSSNIDICSGLLEFSMSIFIECELETFIVRIDESEVLGSHSEQKFLESVCEVMARITVDGSSIQIDEQVFESHFLHSLDRLLRIGGIGIGTEGVYETIIIISFSIIVDQVGHKCSNTIDSSSIGFRFFWIEDFCIEIISKDFCILLQFSLAWGP